MRAAIPIVIAVLFLAGCATPATTPVMRPETKSIIVVKDQDAQVVIVNVTNGTGAVVGYVLSDGGFGLGDARIIILGADKGGTTNATGWFEIKDIPPGKRLMHAERDGYRAAESEIEIEAGKAQQVTVTLVPAVDGDAGYRPHLHDYWAGRSEVLVADHDVTFHRSRNPGAYGTVDRSNQIVSAGTYQSQCVSDAGARISSASSSFTFSDPNQIVWPGTARIDLSITWDSTDYVGSNKVGVAWRSANSTKFVWSKPLLSGETMSIPVEPPMWDSGHHPFTLWRFHLCLEGQGERIQGVLLPGRLFLGAYHVKITLVRGHELVADPPHPRFWENGTTIRALDAYRNITCTGTTACLFWPVNGRVHMQYFGFQPKRLIPPGTGDLVVNLSWSYSLPTGTKPLSIIYAPANVPPWAQEDLAKYSKVAPTEKTQSSRSYRIKLAPGEADAFYQATSNWNFVWGYEGEEGNGPFVVDCGCDIRIRLTADAHSNSQVR